MMQYKLSTLVAITRIHWQTLRECTQRFLALALVMAILGNSLFTQEMFAQGIPNQGVQTGPAQSQPQAPSAKTEFTLPAGTRLPLDCCVRFPLSQPSRERMSICKSRFPWPRAARW